jgi:hypothetical protein
MKPEELIANIKGAYQAGENGKTISKRTFRGTKASIGSFAEDQFALYLDSVVPACYEIWVDPQICHDTAIIASGKGNRKRRFRPDICIIEKNKVKMVFEVKTDLGFQRDIVEKLPIRDAELELFRNGTSHCTINKQSHKNLDFTPCRNCYFILFSTGNCEILTEARELLDKTVFILGTGNPNSPSGTYSVNKAAFRALKNILDKSLTGKRSTQ